MATECKFRQLHCIFHEFSSELYDPILNLTRKSDLPISVDGDV